MGAVYVELEQIRSRKWQTPCPLVLFRHCAWSASVSICPSSLSLYPILHHSSLHLSQYICCIFHTLCTHYPLGLLRGFVSLFSSPCHWPFTAILISCHGFTSPSLSFSSLSPLQLLEEALGSDVHWSAGLGGEVSSPNNSRWG